MAKSTSVFQTYYRLTKPGIIYGNAITASAGFLFASAGRINVVLFGAMLVGLSLVMASACVFNNYLDRGIDAVMARTRKRALVTGQVSGRAALIYASGLGLIGIIVLAVFTNLLTAGLAATGFIAYVALYGWGKRHSIYGTEIGSISGAVPPVVGYTAVTGYLDSGALILFLILVFWQMPHFYAVATYRLDDYSAAKLPVLPAAKGLRRTRIEMLIYIIAFILATLSLAVLNYTGFTYELVAGLLGLGWIWVWAGGRKAPDPTKWARTMFKYSLLVITVLSVVIAFGRLLP
jgi:protoheme IX farnesyltransferase